MSRTILKGLTYLATSLHRKKRSASDVPVLILPIREAVAQESAAPVLVWQVSAHVCTKYALPLFSPTGDTDPLSRSGQDSSLRDRRVKELHRPKPGQRRAR